MRRLCAALLASACLTVPATAASFDDIPGYDQVIGIAGDITEGDFTRLGQTLARHKQQGKPVVMVLLNSDGGNVHEAGYMAGLIRSEGLVTAVAPGHVCISACVLVFAGGKTRYLSPTAQLGVHGTAFADGRESADGTIAVAKMMSALGTPADVITKMVTTPNADVTYLNAYELGDWVEVEEEGAAQPDNTPTASLPRYEMICRSDKGTDYVASLTSNPGYIQLGVGVYPIDKRGVTDKGFSYVAGPTKYGRYAATFDGNLVIYNDGKREAVDYCR